MERKTYELVEENGHKGIKCLDCNMTSFNENDIKHLYCGNCHEFHDLKELRKKLNLPNPDETFQEWTKRTSPIFYWWTQIEPYIVGIGVVAWFTKIMIMDIFFPHSPFTFVFSLFYGYMIGAGIAAYYIRRIEKKEREEADKWRIKNSNK